MGALLGLVLGSGLFLIWWSCWQTPPRPARPSALRRRWQEDLAASGLPLPGTRAVVGLALGAGLVVTLVGLVVSRVPSIAACFGLIAAWAPFALVRSRARKRRVHLRDVWPEAVDNLVSGVRAGLSLPEALAQLADRGPEPLRPAFAQFSADYRGGGAFGDSLDRLKDRLADPVADRICEALRVAREVGGTDLGTLLRSLSTFLREDARTRAELQARQSWTVNGAKLAVAAPWLVLAIMATRPEAVAAYRGPSGLLVLVTGGACSAVAYLAMRRIGRLPEDERVLS
ncbi:MAG: type II secretion system F family protein [Kineosporiaceae bacterium]